MDNKCLICGALLPNNVSNYGDRRYVNCPVCGHYGITNSALREMETVSASWKFAPALLSHAIRNATEKIKPRLGDDTLVFDIQQVQRILESRQLPSVREQANSFIRWLGDQLRSSDPGGKIHLKILQCASIMAAGTPESASQVLSEMTKIGMISENQYIGDDIEVGLTFSGWDLYEELQRAHSEGPIAFMAMPFGDESIDDVFRNCFVPAARQCGFDLRRINERPPAGLIDNRLRVEIRRSRFVIVDLTNENRGAYWEAGFAEGLGKPVIYTCEQSFFKKSGTHFDTNHHHTIVWQATDLTSAALQLKDTIRATLPGEAKLSDN
jgi:hypothetical protein